MLEKLILPNLNVISLVHVRTMIYFYHESWENDICSFTGMTIAL